MAYIPAEVRSQVRVLLSAIPGVSVVAGRGYALPRDSLPAIGFTVSTAINQDAGVAGKNAYDLTLKTEIVADGDDEDLVLDAIDVIELEVVRALDGVEIIVGSIFMVLTASAEPEINVESSRVTIRKEVSFVMGYRVVEGDHETVV